MSETIQLIKDLSQLDKRRGCAGLNLIGPEHLRYEGRRVEGPVHLLIGDGTLESALRVIATTKETALVVDPNAFQFAPPFFELLNQENYTDAAAALGASFYEHHYDRVSQGMLQFYRQYARRAFSEDLNERLYVFSDYFQNVPDEIADRVSCFHPNPGDPQEAYE